MTSNSAGRFVTEKILRIDVNERYSKIPENINHVAAETLAPADVHLEDEPTVTEWLRELVPTKADTIQYARGLFPFTSWIHRYNPSWLAADVLAGITIGLVVVPQAMAYAALAQLSPEYGLYTSLIGAAIYWAFGTSKDIVIGTTAIGSLMVGDVVSHVHKVAPETYTNSDIANGLSLMTGVVILFFGVLRLGFVVEFIPYIPISAFVTAASVTILSTQVPNALGIAGINTREAPYKVIINTCKALPRAQLDAAIGVTSIVILFAIRDTCTYLQKRYPQKKRIMSLISSMRMTFVMILFLIISYVVNKGRSKEEARFRIIGHIEKGLQHTGVPKVNVKLIGHIIPKLPAIIIILVIEHIAIAKEMGRRFNYTINPSQEIVALGAANIFSPFIGGYVCTGSFGASAVLSNAGVRTPLVGAFSAVVLILALYALTGAFYYIPKAALAGLIIHAVCNLITPPSKLFQYWHLSPFEAIIWLVGVLVAIFDSLETSIYIGTALSFVLLLVRLARTKGTFLGTVKARRVVRANERLSHDDSGNESERHVFLALDKKSANNPNLAIETPYPGIFIYRFSEGYNYTNQAYHTESLVSHIMQNTRRMTEEHFEKESDRPWNDSRPRKKTKGAGDDLPYLRAIVLDFAAVNNMDVTSVNGLAELRHSLDQYSAPDAVEWHFANIHNRWTRRALAASGFGYPSSQNPEALACWKPAYPIANVLGDRDAEPSISQRTSVSDVESNTEKPSDPKVLQLSHKDASTSDNTLSSAAFNGDGNEIASRRHLAAVSAVNRPFFHIDLTEAVAAAVRDVRVKCEKFRR